jgi:hypothetical protein
MNYTPRDIRQIKLVSGEEILTEVVGEDGDEFLIANPLRVNKEKYSSNGVQREANFFSRWMGFADNQEFIIRKTHIITEAIVNDNVAEYYNKMMENVEQDDEVHLSGAAEAEHPDFIPSEEDLDGSTFH